VIAATTLLRVRYAETDQMGVAYYANYFAWFEVGRCEALRAAGYSYRQLEEEDGLLLPVIEASCRYLQSGRYDDEIAITATGHLLSGARLAFDYDLARTTDGVQLATGRTVHAVINRAGRPCRLPVHIRTLLS
jgi:acyl-CoA thioester hydrolase